MRLLRKVLMVAGLALAGLLTIPSETSPASAHNSSYCGHGTVGLYNITKFESSYPVYFAKDAHAHRYAHYVNLLPPFGWGFTHYQVVICPH